MADLNNLLAGDKVIWISKEEIIHATVKSKGKNLVCIEFEHRHQMLTRWVEPKKLRLMWGGRKRLEREGKEFQAALDFARAYSVGPQRLREVFEREKAAGNVTFDYSEMEARVLAYEKMFPKIKELKGKKL